VLLEGSALRRLASRTRIEGTGVPRSVRVLQIVTGAVVLVYLASTILRSPGSYSTFYDVWVANFGYAGCAALCV